MYAREFQCANALQKKESQSPPNICCVNELSVGARTRDLLLSREPLYPTELLDHIKSVQNYEKVFVVPLENPYSFIGDSLYHC